MKREDYFQEEGEIFYNVEMPLVAVLAYMEYCGVGFEVERLEANKEEVRKAIKKIEKEVNEMVGEELELNKNAKIAKILYDKLNLPKPNKKKEGKKKEMHPSTDKKTLEGLIVRHPQHSKLLQKIVEWRKLSGIVDKHYNVLPSYACYEGEELRMARVYPSIIPTCSATGRIGCKDPNLQCIPNPSFCSGVNINLRKSFVAAAGHVLLSVDYQQIEIRIMAFATKSPQLIQILSVEGADLFKKMAANWKKKREEEVSEEERTIIKQTVYGILYGMGAHTCASRLKVSVREAENLMAQFHRTFPEINEWMKKVRENTARQRRVSTLLGRSRPIEIDQKGKWERQCVNSVCQGTGADILKKALINIYNQLVRLNLRSRILLPIHDELVCPFLLLSNSKFRHHFLKKKLLEVANEELDVVKGMVVQEMENVFPGLRLPVSCESGYGRMKKRGQN